MRTHRFTSLAALLCIAAGARAAERVALAPLDLPAAERRLQAPLQAAVRAGASGLSNVAALEPMSDSACAPDEGRCLAASARTAKADLALSGEVATAEHGYRFHLRAFAAADGAARGDEKGEVRGGPLDLEAAVEGAACRLLSGMACSGQLVVTVGEGGPGAHLFVDGKDKGPLPLAGPLALPVGRHAVRVASAEQRVHISHGLTVRLLAEGAAGSASLVVESAPLAASAAAPVERPYAHAPVVALAEPSAEGRAGAARLLVASGLGLLAAGAGVGLVAQFQSQATQAPARTALVEPGNNRARTTGIAAAALLAAGAGSLVAGGLVFALTPSGPSVSGRF